MKNEILLFYVTHPNEKHANQMCGKLVDEGLIACSNVFAMKSTFFWDGTLCSEGEVVSILKTRPDLEDRVEARIQELHDYDVPAILRFEVECNDLYKKWIEEQTAQ